MEEIVKRIVNLSNAERGAKDDGYFFDISDETPDMHGTVFRISAWENGDKFQSPVTYGHPALDDNDPDNASIAVSDVTIDRKSKVMRAFIADNQWDTGDPENPNVAKVKRKLANGTLTKASIRATVSDGDFGDTSRGEDRDIFYFTKARLMDWGIVPHGSNPNAMKRGAEELIKSKEAKEDEPVKTNRLQLLELKNKFYSK